MIISKMNVQIKNECISVISEGDASSIESQVVPSMTILAKDSDQVTI